MVRRKALWIVVPSASLLIAAALFVVWRQPGSSRPEFRRYISAATRGDTQDAFAMLCPEAQGAMPDYERRLADLLAMIGRVSEVGGLSSSRTELQAAYLGGTRRDVAVRIRMVKLNSSWYPCPLEGPLGRIENVNS
jgi:hypothetical protein